MKVKILKEKYYRDLEVSLNNWLEKSCEKHDVIDIKYTGRGSSAPYASDEYSAMIIYK